MKNILISGGLQLYKEMSDAKETLEKLGYSVVLPPTAVEILDGKITREQIISEKGNQAFVNRTVKDDAIRRFYKLICDCDAILIFNITRKGVDSYIGGGSFLEIGFAHVLNKKIFLLNDVPHMNYTDEISAMQPVCLKGKLEDIKKHF